MDHEEIWRKWLANASVHKNYLGSFWKNLYSLVSLGDTNSDGGVQTRNMDILTPSGDVEVRDPWPSFWGILEKRFFKGPFQFQWSMTRLLALPDMIDVSVRNWHLLYIGNVHDPPLSIYGLTLSFLKLAWKKWKANEEKNRHFQLLRNVTQLWNYSKPRNSCPITGSKWVTQKKS